MLTNPMHAYLLIIIGILAPFNYADDCPLISHFAFLCYADECTAGTHQCQHQCHNTPGTYTCSCDSGFSLDSDGVGCTPDLIHQPPPTTCGGLLTGASGSFETNGWPNSYPHGNFQCEWTIQAPQTATRIYFYFDGAAFGINGQDPCTNDHIEFFDGIGGNAPSIRKICGGRDSFVNLPTILMSSTQARVVFTGSGEPRPIDRFGVKVYYIAF